MPKRDKTWNKGQGRGRRPNIRRREDSSPRDEDDHPHRQPSRRTRDDRSWSRSRSPPNEMIDIDLGTQTEMTDLDQAEMTNFCPKASPILNTSRGRCTAPWSKYALEVLRLSRLLAVVRLLVEHHQRLQGQHRVQRWPNVWRRQDVLHATRGCQNALEARPVLLPEDWKAGLTRRTFRIMLSAN